MGNQLVNRSTYLRDTQITVGSQGIQQVHLPHTYVYIRIHTYIHTYLLTTNYLRDTQITVGSQGSQQVHLPKRTPRLAKMTHNTSMSSRLGHTMKSSYFVPNLHGCRGSGVCTGMSTGVQQCNTKLFVPTVMVYVYQRPSVLCKVELPQDHVQERRPHCSLFGGTGETGETGEDS